MNSYIVKLIDANLLDKTQDGLTCCRWCNKGVMPPRRTLCSKECAHEIRLRTDGNYLRSCVYNRDKGICAICNIDTKKIVKTALSLNLFERNEYLQSLNISLKRKIYIRKFGGSLWDADHIIQVRDGGGCCGLDNIRTLCISCHKIITAQGHKMNSRKVKE